MKKLFQLLLVILLVEANVTTKVTEAHLDDPVLIKVTFSSHTNDDNKDHDTGVYVKVMTEDGSTLLAHADNRDSSGSDSTEYNDGSDHEFSLDVDGAGVSKNSCRKFKVIVSQQTNGNDTWKFNARITLIFSDKTNLIATRDGIELKNNGAAADFQAP